MSDNELARILEDNRDEYSDEALELVRAEIRDRAGRGDVGPEENVEAEEPVRASKVSWMDVYIALLGAGAVGGPIALLLFFERSQWWAIPFYLMVGAVAVGLHRRRAWAYYLNFVVLLINTSVAARSAPGFLAGLAWLIANFWYFGKRRRQFFWGPTRHR